MRGECSERRFHVARLIRSAGNSKCLANAITVHANFLEHGVALDRYLSNLLVEMYGKCSSVDHARTVFASIQYPNIFSWNILLEASARNGQVRETKLLFDNLCHRDVWTWTSLVSAFSHFGGHLLEAKAAFERMPQRDPVSCNVMLSALAEAGRVEDAEALFIHLPCPTTVTWTIMLDAFARHKDFVKLEVIFEKIPGKDIVSWIVVLTAFARVADLRMVKSMFDCMPQHSIGCYNTLIAATMNDNCIATVEEICSASPERDIVSWNTMLCAYARHGYIEELTDMFQNMRTRNIVSWDTLLCGVARHGSVQQAGVIFLKVPSRSPASWTCMISAQADAGHLKLAKRLFDDIPQGQADVMSWNCIMLTYARHLGHENQDKIVNEIAIAEEVFQRMPAVNVVSYNALLALYARSVRITEAWRLFQAIPQQDSVSWGTMVSAYVCVGDLTMARKMLQRMPQQHIVPFNAVLAGYVQLGNVEEACKWFGYLPMKDIVSWNLLVAVYAKSNAKDHWKAAVALFAEMDLAGLPVTVVTFLNVLEAYSKLADVALARVVHTTISETVSIATSSIDDKIAVGNALINMYGKCGCINEALSVFDGMRRSSCLSIVSWNTMILANATKGHGEESFYMFREMNLEGWIPDEPTLVAVLISCSRMGSIQIAQLLFCSIVSDYGCSPTAGHYFCIVDALSRAGLLGKAQELVHNMPFEPDSVGWKALLSASNTQGDVSRAVDYAVSAILVPLENDNTLGEEDSFPYVQLSNLYVTLPVSCHL